MDDNAINESLMTHEIDEKRIFYDIISNNNIL